MKKLWIDQYDQRYWAENVTQLMQDRLRHFADENNLKVPA